MRRLVPFALTVVVLLLVPVSRAGLSVSQAPLAALLQTDSTAPHEQIPHGVPAYYDWYSHPVLHDGTDRNGYGYANPWGQVYDPATGNPLPADRVEIRELQEWYLSRTSGQWVALYPTPPPITAWLFSEDFQGPTACARYDNTSYPGSILASPHIACGGTQVSGYLLHFYPAVARAQINGADVAALVVQARIRLAKTNPADPRYPGLIANVGADFWSTPSGSVSSGAGEGRFVTVKHDWRTLTWTSETPTQLQANPLPPITTNPAELY